MLADFEHIEREHFFTGLLKFAEMKESQFEIIAQYPELIQLLSEERKSLLESRFMAVVNILPGALVKPFAGMLPAGMVSNHVSAEMVFAVTHKRAQMDQHFIAPRLG